MESGNKSHLRYDRLPVQIKTAAPLKRHAGLNLSSAIEAAVVCGEVCPEPGAFELQLKKGQWRLRDSIWLQKAEQRKLRDSIRLQFNKKFQEELLEKKEQWRLRDSSIRLRMTELRKQRDSIRVQLNEKFREKKHEKIVVHPQKFNFDFRYNSPAGKKIDAR